MKDFEFSWLDEGTLMVACAEEDNILASLIAVDLDGYASRSLEFREFLERTNEAQGERQEYRTGEGFRVSVQGEEATIESIFELYEDKSYPIVDLLALLDQLDRWLGQNLGTRPSWPGRR